MNNWGEEGRSSVLRLKVVGAFEASLNGVEIAITNRKCRALLSIVALSDGRRCLRERLRGLLWSELDERRAQNNLRQCLHILNERIFAPVGYTGLVADRTTVAFASAAAVTDVEDWFENLATGRVPPALRQNPTLIDSLLTDLEATDPAFRDWAGEFRAAASAQLLAQATRAMQSGEPAETRSAAADLVAALEPLNELACRIRMQARAECGETAAALTVYQALWEQIDDAFGEEPSPETQALAVAVKQSEVGPARTPSPMITPIQDSGRPRIVVAPLERVALLDDRTDRLVSAFRAELIASLVRFREWRIFERGAGSVEHADYSLILTSVPGDSSIALLVTLQNAASGELVWSERLNRPLATWVRLQNEVVRRLAVALNIHLSLDRIERGVGFGDFSLDAYDRWLRGEALMMEQTQESWLRAEQIFEDIIARSPRFTRGYCGRAGIENMRHLAFPGLMVPRDRRERALDLARTATRIDPIDSRTQLCLAWSNAMLGRFDQAELAFGLAHQHNENDPWTMVSAAVGLAFCGRTEVADALSEQALAMELQPSPAYWAHMTATYFLAGRYEDCVRAAINAEDTTVDVPAWQSAAEAHLGEMENARTTCDRLVRMATNGWAGEVAPSRPAIAAWLGEAFPIRSETSRNRLISGLSAAGLSEAGQPSSPALLR